VDMTVGFPDGLRVDVQAGDFVIPTDQPASSGGDGSAPTPFMTFLAALAACAGFYVLAFCRQRGLSTEGVRLIQRTTPREHGGVSRISLEIHVPESFPTKYHEALVRAAEQCMARKQIEAAPEFQTQTIVDNIRQVA
jgi:putative redox protein